MTDYTFISLTDDQIQHISNVYEAWDYFPVYHPVIQLVPP